MDGSTTSRRENVQLYRMVTENHVCPYGLKSKALLESRFDAVEDHLLRSREETDAFKQQHEVETTPQIFIDGERIGGYDALRRYFGKPAVDSEQTTYAPIIAIFAMTALMAAAGVWALTGGLAPVLLLEWFVALSMCVLAIQKLRDLDSFSLQFLSYDLLAQRWVPYAKLYPFGEAAAGVLMLAGALRFLAGPLAMFIGLFGAISVIKAVYIDKRELRCACVGGSSRVPLGFISLTENLMMLGMGGWMLVKAL